MTICRKSFLIALAVAPALTLSSVNAEDALTTVYSTKDLSGWKVPDNNIWWKVEDGILKVRSGPDKKGSILWSEKEFTDFTVEAEFKFISGTIDSGIHIRNMDQIQIGISGSLKRDMTASPYIPGKGYPVEAEGVAELLKQDDWNQMRVEVSGKEYVCYLNGKKVMSYTSDTAIAKGPIGLQLHAGKDMSIDFRNIKVVEKAK
ncbi:MAG: DUF1080 domain-containing protein [Verrucomicrobiales bacterium]|nr:DUF1080 domain-containing protein [Verrucomicrobiales bacterium]